MQELKHFKFGAVTIQTTTEQLSKLKEICIYIIDTEISSRKKDYVKMIRKMH